MMKKANLQVLFNKYNQVNKLGCLTCLYRQYKPKDEEEFKRLYLKEYSEEYNDVILKLKTDVKEYSYSDLVNFLDKKLFTNTIEGIKKELKAQEIIKNSGYKVEQPNENDDVKLGIDFKCFKDNKLKFLIQVKPHTFFIGNTNESLVRDRKKAIEKERLAKSKYKVPVIYLVYNKNNDEFIKNKQGKYSYLLTNLINHDGTTKN